MKSDHKAIITKEKTKVCVNRKQKKKEILGSVHKKYKDGKFVHTWNKAAEKI